MNVSNDYYVNKGRTLIHKGKYFRQGHRFPAANLGIVSESFEALIRDGSIVKSGKAKTEEAPPSPLREGEGLEDKSKEELQQIAEDSGIEYPARANKEKLIELIREKAE